MLVALAHTARDLGVGLLSACFVLGLGLALGRIMRGPETPEFIPPSQPKDAGDLDDWLGQDGLDFDFKVYRQPAASVRVGGSDGLR
jgi:hypothetical protein